MKYLISSLSFLIVNLIYAQVSLNVNAIPRSVEVLIDGKKIGKTPLKDVKINPGVHSFELRKKGYAPLKHLVDVNPAESLKMDYYLNPIYLIKFFTEERGLSFELNDTHKWSQNKIRLEIEAGEHQLRVYQNNKIIDEQIFIIDEPKSIEYIIKKKISS